MIPTKLSYTNYQIEATQRRAEKWRVPAGGGAATWTPPRNCAEGHTGHEDTLCVVDIFLPGTTASIV